VINVLRFELPAAPTLHPITFTTGIVPYTALAHGQEVHVPGTRRSLVLQLLHGHEHRGNFIVVGGLDVIGYGITDQADGWPALVFENDGVAIGERPLLPAGALTADIPGGTAQARRIGSKGKPASPRPPC
jgi:hypothetical protein